jgi:predicted membrane channel-forming protein YqfA (hemolysin III family)
VHLQLALQQQQQQGCLLHLVALESAVVGVACCVLQRAAWSSVRLQLYLVLMQQHQQQMRL